MYHRFNENKYPSTNIKMEIFKEHINIIKNSDFNFHNPNNFDEQFKKPKLKKDGTLSKSGLTEIEYSERVKTNNIKPFSLYFIIKNYFLKNT